VPTRDAEFFSGLVTVALSGATMGASPLPSQSSAPPGAAGSAVSVCPFSAMRPDFPVTFVRLSIIALKGMPPGREIAWPEAPDNTPIP
jgi:hypothetical protein